MVQWYNRNNVRSILRHFTDVLLNTQELLQVFLTISAKSLSECSAHLAMSSLPLKQRLNGVLWGSETQQNTRTVLRPSVDLQGKYTLSRSSMISYSSPPPSPSHSSRQLWGESVLFFKHMPGCIHYQLPAKNFHNHSLQKWIEFLHAWRLSQGRQQNT